MNEQEERIIPKAIVEEFMKLGKVKYPRTTSIGDGADPPNYTTGTDESRINIKMDGIRVEVFLNYTYTIHIYVRNENGGMNKVRELPYVDECDVISKITEALKHTTPASKTKIDRTPIVRKFINFDEGPWPKFVRGEAHWPNSRDGFKSVKRSVGYRPQVEEVFNVHLVNLDGRKIDKDLFLPSKDNLWFHVECQNSLGATFDILTNGEEFMAVDRYSKFADGKGKVTNVTSPKASVDLTLMNQDDQEIIKYAIDSFMTEQVNNEPKST